MSGAAVVDRSPCQDPEAPKASARRRWIIAAILCMATLELGFRLTGAEMLRVPSWVATGLVV
ncbi:hypothetical protein LCGC14_2395070, partial [marine sediment metagenome]